MTNNLNKTVIVGRLGAAPQIHYTQRGVPFAVLSLSSNRQPLINGKTEQQWHRVVAWDRLGLICSQTLRKGNLLCIEGSLANRFIRKSRSGGNTVTEIVARSVKMLDRGLSQ